MAEVVSNINAGDTAWMLTSSLLVLFMILPGLALFYGGLVRAKNMLSVLMQCTIITSVVMVIYVLYGYSLSFGGSESAFWGGLGKSFLAGVTPDSESGTIPELVFVAFQMTFACITPALIVGGFAERMKFSAVILFVILWVTLVYFPIAHMAWDANGLYFGWGRDGLRRRHRGAHQRRHRGAGGRDAHRAAHRLPQGDHGAALDDAHHGRRLDPLGRLVRLQRRLGALGRRRRGARDDEHLRRDRRARSLSWSAIEAIFRGKASMLGAASGMVAGLVAVTPAAGFVGPLGAIVLGVVAAAGCYFFVQVVKEHFGYDDSLDVFGVHGIGGIVGAIGTGFLASTAFGGVGYADGVSMGGAGRHPVQGGRRDHLWCGVGSFVLYKLVDMIVGLRVAPETEREGLDLAEHGERAYVY